MQHHDLAAGRPPGRGRRSGPAHDACAPGRVKMGPPAGAGSLVAHAHGAALPIAALPVAA